MRSGIKKIGALALVLLLICGVLASSLLIDNGVDLHNYQPTADDMVKLAACDLFVYVGGESDGWVDNALRGATNSARQTVRLMDVLAEHLHQEEHDPNETAAHDEAHEEHEADEHVWLSLKNADRVCAALAEKLAALDPQHAEDYRANQAAYSRRLGDLDAAYQAAVRAGTKKALLFGDRFPFLYLAEDYGIAHYAAFSGCSAETEASFAVVKALAEKMDELGLNAVLVTESSDRKIAETVIAATREKNQVILTMDSMQSVTQAQIQGGQTYLKIAESNLDVLKAALA